MVNECVGPDSDGCTAKSVTPAKYGTHSRDGGKLCGACYGKKYQRTSRCRAESPIPPSKLNSSRGDHALDATHGRGPRVAPGSRGDSDDPPHGPGLQVHRMHDFVLQPRAFSLPFALY